MRLAFKILLVLAFSLSKAGAFSLLGPYQDWMQYTNGFRQPGGGQSPGDIGGPMDIQEEYRWNVPLLTYAFDQSFLNYFGTNGVAAVEQAIQILNDLPNASQILPGDYPPVSREVNYLAQALSCYDLKSATLSLLLEQMGLGEPTRNIFALRDHGNLASWTGESMWPTGTIPNLILLRNFYPATLAPSHYVNDTLYSAIFYKFDDVSAVVTPFAVDPTADTFTAVADNYRSSGEFYSALTKDDVGGLQYLLRSNNMNFEYLLPDIHGAGTNFNSYVNGAWRPGVEKITFIRQLYDALLGQAIPITNQFIDTYITNGAVKFQQLERIITQPDFLFSAGDTGATNIHAPWVVRSDTGNWQNNASANGLPGTGGPGLIRPTIRITFHTLGSEANSYDYESSYDYVIPNAWASFDGTTNLPIVYPSTDAAGINNFTVHLILVRQTPRRTDPFVLRVPCSIGTAVSLQASTNLTSWTTVATVTHCGGVVMWYQYHTLPEQYFRAVAQ